jgi:hypothetical protein
MGEQGGPEGRTNQQDRRPSPVCNTAIAGSSPGGASTTSIGETRYLFCGDTITCFANVPELRPLHGEREVVCPADPVDSQ